MKMTPVTSSNINKIGFDRSTLYVEFNNGRLYAYYNVPESEYNALMSASSKGIYLSQNIKGRYQYKPLG